MYELSNRQKFKTSISILCAIAFLLMILGIFGMKHYANIQKHHNNYFDDFKDFDCVIMSHNISYDDNDKNYQLDFFAKNDKDNNCTFYNYYENSNLTDVTNIATNELYSYVKWSKIKNTNECTNRKHYEISQYEKILFGINMIVLSFSFVLILLIAILICDYFNHNECYNINDNPNNYLESNTNIIYKNVCKNPQDDTT